MPDRLTRRVRWLVVSGGTLAAVATPAAAAEPTYGLSAADLLDQAGALVLSGPHSATLSLSASGFDTGTLTVAQKVADPTHAVGRLTFGPGRMFDAPYRSVLGGLGTNVRVVNGRMYLQNRRLGRQAVWSRASDLPLGWAVSRPASRLLRFPSARLLNDLVIGEATPTAIRMTATLTDAAARSLAGQIFGSDDLFTGFLASGPWTQKDVEITVDPSTGRLISTVVDLQAGSAEAAQDIEDIGVFYRFHSRFSVGLIDTLPTVRPPDHAVSLRSIKSSLTFDYDARMLLEAGATALTQVHKALGTYDATERELRLIDSLPPFFVRSGRALARQGRVLLEAATRESFTLRTVSVTGKTFSYVRRPGGSISRSCRVRVSGAPCPTWKP